MWVKGEEMSVISTEGRDGNAEGEQRTKNGAQRPPEEVYRTHTHTHTCLTALCLGLPG